MGADLNQAPRYSDMPKYFKIKKYTRRNRWRWGLYNENKKLIACCAIWGFDTEELCAGSLQAINPEFDINLERIN